MNRFLMSFNAQEDAGPSRGAAHGFAGAVLLAAALLVAGCAALQPVWAPRQPRARPPAQAQSEAAPASLLPSGAAARPVAELSPREQMMEIQIRLAAAGYDPGPADGLYGARTAAAITRYRRVKGLKENITTRDLLVHLRGERGPAPPKTSVAGLQIVAVHAADEPAYEAGDHYVYSDGEVHSVVRVDPDSVAWRESGGVSYTTLHAAGLPRLNWRDGVWQGRVSFDRKSASPWPPGPGDAVTFDVRSEEWVEGDAGSRLVMESRWTCRGEGEGELDTMAGRFDVETFFCERSPAPAGAWQRRYLYYARSLGHIVLIEDQDGAGLSLGRRELVAVLPGGKDWQPAIRTGLGRAIQDTLNTRAVGTSRGWQAPTFPDRFAIKVTGEFKAQDGAPCRSYVVTRVRRDTRRDYPAAACRDGATKHWTVPGSE